jgi:hypothetical protein
LVLKFEKLPAIVEVISDRDDWSAASNHFGCDRRVTATGCDHYDIAFPEMIEFPRFPRVDNSCRPVGQKAPDSSTDNASSDHPDSSHHESGSTGRHPPRVGGVPSREPTLMLAAVNTASASAERMRKITFMAGGDDGIRTHDPLLAKQVL